MAKKSTNVEIERRVNAVFRMLLEGIDPRVIQPHASEKWGVTERTVRTYLQRANLRYKEIAAYDALQELGKVMARNELLFREAWKEKKLGLCHSINQDRAKLLGLYEPETFEFINRNNGQDVSDDDIVKLSDDQLRVLALGDGSGGPTSTRQH